MAQVKTQYSAAPPPLQKDDTVYLIDLSPCGTHVQHHAINMFTKELSIYGCRTNGEYLFRKVTGNGIQKNYRGGFHRLAVSVSTVGFALTCGIIGIALSSEGTKNLNVQNSLGILAILACTVIIPMGTYYGLRWIAEGFKGK